MFDSFSPLENLKAFAITYTAGVPSVILAISYVNFAKKYN